MSNILTDIVTALKMTGDVRRARKAGASAVKAQPIWEVPVVDFGYWSFTMEACLYYGKEFKAMNLTESNILSALMETFTAPQE